MFPYRVITVLGLRLRNEPTTNSATIGKLPYGTIVFGEPIDSGDWLKTNDGYCAIWHSGIRLMDLAWGKIRGYVLHDIDVYGVSRPERNEIESGAPNNAEGLPETVKMRDSRLIDLTRELQWYWYGELQKRNPNMTEEERKKGWASMTRGWAAVTNKFGSLQYADYINKTNDGAPPMKLEPIIMGGAEVTLLGRAKFGRAPNIEYCYKILTDSAKVRIGLFYNPTISRRDRTVIPFSQFDVPLVPIMTLDKQYNFIPQARIRVLREGESLSPYVR
jgi:hypothetical protein